MGAVSIESFLGDQGWYTSNSKDETLYCIRELGKLYTVEWETLGTVQYPRDDYCVSLQDTIQGLDRVGV